MSKVEQNGIVVEAEQARSKAISNLQNLRLNQDSALGSDFVGIGGARRGT